MTELMLFENCRALKLISLNILLYGGTLSDPYPPPAEASLYINVFSSSILSPKFDPFCKAGNNIIT